MGTLREPRTALPDDVWPSIVERAGDAIFITRETLEIVWVNRQACAAMEYSAAELVGRDVRDFFWDPDEIRREPLRRDALIAGERARVERPFRTGSGRRIVLEVHGHSIGHGLLVGVARDVTQRKIALERLARSESSFRALIDRSPDATIVHARGTILYANAAVVQMLGYDAPGELVGRPVLDIMHPDDRPSVHRRIASLREGHQTLPFVDERVLRRDGSTLLVTVGAVRVVFEGQNAVAAMARDPTEERMLAAQLARNERMAALGMLSAGVAHEINNPLAYVLLRLGAIQSECDQLRVALARARAALVERFGPGAAAEELGLGLDAARVDRLADHARTAREGADRVHTIVDDLRMFSRTDAATVQPIDVRGPLRRALELTGHEIQNRARVVATLADVPPVLASDGRLTQVFVNLLLNALQAIPPGAAERNTVRVATSVAEAGRVAVAIADTGVGVAPADLPRLFEPFFTTKPAGVGTGLGLAICHGIVADLGGSIRVDSEPGVGTTFTVLLPVAAGGDGDGGDGGAQGGGDAPDPAR